MQFHHGNRGKVGGFSQIDVFSWFKLNIPMKFQGKPGIRPDLRHRP
jgi:hypothetical protein